MNNRFSRRRNAGQGGRDFNRLQLHKTVCSSCKKDCEVPFKPTGSKPIFCRDCFQNNRRSNFDNRNDDKNKTTEQPLYKEQFVALHAKLDKILKILTPVTEITEITPKTHLPQIIQEDKQSKETVATAPNKKRVYKKKAAV